MKEEVMTSKKSKQDALIDELLQDCDDPQEILGKNGLLKQLTKRLVLGLNKPKKRSTFLGFHRVIPHGFQRNKPNKRNKPILFPDVPTVYIFSDNRFNENTPSNPFTGFGFFSCRHWNKCLN